MSSRRVYRMCAQLRWRHLVNACEVNAHLIGCWQNLGAVCFWQPIPSGLNLVVVAVLRDSLCVVSLLLCVADCCMIYTVCKVEWFVLTIIKRRLLLLLLLLKLVDRLIQPVRLSIVVCLLLSLRSVQCCFVENSN